MLHRHIESVEMTECENSNDRFSAGVVHCAGSVMTSPSTTPQQKWFTMAKVHITMDSVRHERVNKVVGRGLGPVWALRDNGLQKKQRQRFHGCLYLYI